MEIANKQYNNKNIIYPFAFPFYKTILKQNIFNDIKKEVFDYINQFPNCFKEGWDSNTNTSFYEKDTPFKSNILEFLILSKVQEYTDTFEFKYPLKLNLSECWVNNASPGSFQECHSHLAFNQNNIISGTIYIQIPENSGNFYIKNPNNISQIFPNSNAYPSDIYITPTEGLLMLFPSWLEHSVGVNKSKEQRLSVSFNLSINN
jgi:uncharacterized protein (TIGR02466 family)